MKKRKGFVQLAILHLLKEQAMHGYQIMKELEDRSDGLYKASAGTIYPALQELLDQELINPDDQSDKKVYLINEKGKERIIEFAKREEAEFWTKWRERLIWRNSDESVQLKSAIDLWDSELRNAIKHARRNPKSAAELIDFLNEMTERLKNDHC